MPKYRCPVDDCVFDTMRNDRQPTLEGHPECPGPECQKRFAAYSGRPQSEPAAPRTEGGQQQGGQQQPSLTPPPVGQGW